MWQQLLQQIGQGNFKALARAISLVENEFEGYFPFLKSLPASTTKLIGITGPPGAGKSTLVDALVHQMVSAGSRVGIICVDPSSPFNLGALLGDRIRMSDWYNYPDVFIRSLATRGSLGGLHPKIIEITDVMKAGLFDHIIIETVGVGQSEIEIAGLADTTVVVVVPEAGDEVQTMKAGLMEIANIFVVNKADRPGADEFVNNLQKMLRPSGHEQATPIPVIKTEALQKTGVRELYEAILQHEKTGGNNKKRNWLLAERAWYLMQRYKMKAYDKAEIKLEIDTQTASGNSFNLYDFVEEKIGATSGIR